MVASLLMRGSELSRLHKLLLNSQNINTIFRGITQNVPSATRTTSVKTPHGKTARPRVRGLTRQLIARLRLDRRQMTSLGAFAGSSKFTLNAQPHVDFLNRQVPSLQQTGSVSLSLLDAEPPGAHVGSSLDVIATATISPASVGNPKTLTAGEQPTSTV